VKHSGANKEEDGAKRINCTRAAMMTARTGIPAAGQANCVDVNPGQHVRSHKGARSLSSREFSEKRDNCKKS